MASIFDADGLQVGTIEAIADGVIAFNIDGRRIGRFGTSLDAVSACFAAWRRDGQPAPTEQGEELLFEAISARMLAGNDAT